MGVYIVIARPAHAAECSFPDNVNWIVDQSCEISSVQIAPQNLSVINGATLSIEQSGELILDMRRYRISVGRDSRLTVAPGGRIRSNQIGPLLVRGTDGGTFGYFLKRVGGPVLDTINPDLSFHPSSAIKTLYMVEALRQVNSGSLNLNTTSLISCPTTVVEGIAAGQAQSCPNPYSLVQAPDTTENCDVPPVPNTAESCADENGFDAFTINYGLGVGICAMMKVSQNPASNAIQEAVGAGGSTGRLG